MFGDILKNILISKFSKSSSALYHADIYLPEVNFTKFFVRSPEVKTSTVQTALGRQQVNLASKYYNFLAALESKLT